MADAETSLDVRRRIGDEDLGRVGRKDDLVDIRRLEGAVGQSCPGCGQRQIGRTLFIPCNSARVYACARHDPFVRGVDVLRPFVVRHDALGQVDAEAQQADGVRASGAWLVHFVLALVSDRAGVGHAFRFGL